jgi:hypothetical protein
MLYYYLMVEVVVGVDIRYWLFSRFEDSFMSCLWGLSVAGELEFVWIRLEKRSVVVEVEVK